MVVFRRCNSKVCNFGLMNESGLTWRFHNSFRDHLADGSGLRPRLESLVTFLSSDGDVVTTFTLRRMLTTSARCLLGALQSRQGEVFLGFLGLGVCAGSLWSGKKTNQALIMASLSTRTLCLPIFPSWNIYIKRWICQNRFSRSCVQDDTLWNYLQLFMDIKLHTNTQKRSEQNKTTLLFYIQISSMTAMIINSNNIGRCQYSYLNSSKPICLPSQCSTVCFPLLPESGFHANPQVCHNEAKFSLQRLLRCDKILRKSYHKITILR